MHLNNTITKVAVGSDESKWGLKALDIAASFANMWGAELDVISAAPKVQGSDGDKAVMESFMEDLEVRIKPIEESYPDLKITRTVVPGNAVQALTKASYDHAWSSSLPRPRRVHRPAAGLHQPGTDPARRRPGVCRTPQVRRSRGIPS